MTLYRKNSDRQLFKVTGESFVIKVTSKSAYKSIQMYNSEMIAEEVLNDYKEVTQQEFDSLFKECYDSISMQKI